MALNQMTVEFLVEFFNGKFEDPRLKKHNSDKNWIRKSVKNFGSFEPRKLVKLSRRKILLYESTEPLSGFPEVVTGEFEEVVEGDELKPT